MTEVVLEDSTLIIRLSPLEKAGAIHGDVRVPLAAVTGVRVSGDPFGEIRGIRAPGTGWPGVIALGTFRTRGVKDFDAVYQGKPALVIETEGAEFARLVISSDDAEADVARITAALEA